MKRLLGIGALVLTVTGALSAMNAGPGNAESGSMLLIGAGLVVSAALFRQHNRTRG